MEYFGKRNGDFTNKFGCRNVTTPTVSKDKPEKAKNHNIFN